MNKQQVIELLAKNGAKTIKGLKIRNVNTKIEEEYIRVSLTLDKEVDGYVSKPDTTEFEKGKTNVVFLSLYSITAILKESDDYAFLASYVLEHPNTIKVLLSGAFIDIMQEEVAEGQEYVNPWSSDNKTTLFDHSTIINHLINIKLGPLGDKTVERVFDKMIESTI